MKKIRQFMLLADTPIGTLNKWLKKNHDLDIINIQPYSSPELSTSGNHWLIEYYPKSRKNN